MDSEIPPTWGVAKAEIKCREKFEELIVPLMRTAVSTNGQGRFSAYICFAVSHRSDDEVHSWTKRDHCKLVHPNGNVVNSQELKLAGWQS